MVKANNSVWTIKRDLYVWVRDFLIPAWFAYFLLPTCLRSLATWCRSCSTYVDIDCGRFGLVSIEDVMPLYFVWIFFQIWPSERVIPFLFFTSAVGFFWAAPLPLLLWLFCVGSVVCFVSWPSAGIISSYFSTFCNESCHQMLMFYLTCQRWSQWTQMNIISVRTKAKQNSMSTDWYLKILCSG